VLYPRRIGGHDVQGPECVTVREAAALASEVIDSLDSLGIPHCVLGRSDWGARRLCRRGALAIAPPRSGIGRRVPRNARHNLPDERPCWFRSSGGALDQIPR